MSEIRIAPGRSAIIAEARRRRPHAAGRTDTAPAACPFCPGNEILLPRIIAETPRPAAPGWQTRVVPNKFAAFTPDAATASITDGLWHRRPGLGHHEVVIEDPDHTADLATMAAAARAGVVATWRDCSRVLLRQPGMRAAIVFRNHGGGAGASLGHPHSQIIATALVPPLVARRGASWRRHHTRTGCCLLCDMTARERAAEQRIIAGTAHFTAFVPYAAMAPFETWIVPHAHRGGFIAIEDGESADFADLLGAILRGIAAVADDPPYNLVIHSAPKGGEAAAHLHWYVQIVPRLAVAAGFEIGAGMCINPSLPERDAARLAAAVAVPG